MNEEKEVWEKHKRRVETSGPNGEVFFMTVELSLEWLREQDKEERKRVLDHELEAIRESAIKWMEENIDG